MVVPYVGTWIEMPHLSKEWIEEDVVPYVGTWIEIIDPALVDTDDVVVPYVGTWIEIERRRRWGHYY